MFLRISFLGSIYDYTSSYDLSFYVAGVFIILSGILLLVLPAMGKYKKYKAVKKPFPQIDVEKNAKINNINIIGGKLPTIPVSILLNLTVLINYFLIRGVYQWNYFLLLGNPNDKIKHNFK